MGRRTITGEYQVGATPVIAVRLPPEVRAQVVAVLADGESLSDFIRMAAAKEAMRRKQSPPKKKKG